MSPDYSNPNETILTQKPVICWRSTFAGLVVAILTFMGVISLAIAFGGIGLSDGASAKSAGVFSAGSLMFAMALATFVGGYIAARSARSRVDVAGSMQGLVVGAVFMVLMFWQGMMVLGSLGQAAGNAIGMSASTAAAGISAASQSPMVHTIIEDNMGELKLKSDPEVVVRNVATRLIQGNPESAKNYLAAQAGITPAEADQKIAAMKAQADEFMAQTREATASALKATGWSLFVVIVLATIASVLGGLVGTLNNHRHFVDVAGTYKKFNVKAKV